MTVVAPYRAASIARYLGLPPDDIKAQAVVAISRRYRLDPLLSHVVIVEGKVYISHDGMMHVAHESGQLDGIVVEEERESENGYSATVSVWRKDMSHPFTYKGGCGANEPQARAGNGAAMALARAERRALRRAFNIPVYGDGDGPAVDVAGHDGHHIVADDGTTMVCSCGEKFLAGGEFHKHRTAQIEPPPSPGRPAATRQPPQAAPSFRRPPARDHVPDHVYDAAPESRGYDPELQPASYEDPKP